ncbi:MAG: putative PEP-binding protein, partial [Planctomycetota bacterium]
VTRCAGRTGMAVSACGEAAGDPCLAALLVGLGVHELSMSPIRAARVKRLLRQCRIDQLQQLARDALTCSARASVAHMLEEFPMALTGRACPSPEDEEENKA